LSVFVVSVDLRVLYRPDDLSVAQPSVLKGHSGAD